MSAYDSTIDVCLGILILLLLGWLCRFLRIIPPKHTSTAIDILNKFVFFVALPATIIKTMAAEKLTNFSTASWNYIVAFLLVRLFMMVLCVPYTIFIEQGSIPEFLGVWISVRKVISLHPPPFSFPLVYYYSFPPRFIDDLDEHDHLWDSHSHGSLS